MRFDDSISRRPPRNRPKEEQSSRSRSRERKSAEIPQESLLPQQTDKLRLIRAVSDRIQQNMLNAYNPSKDLTVDERMIPFRGHCAFKVYMKNKPCKYGIKMWCCVDPKTSMLVNFDIYAGEYIKSTSVNVSCLYLVHINLKPFFYFYVFL